MTGPDGRTVEADWAALADGTAIVEMARASGLALVGRNDPLTATTYGTGELIAAALDHGCRRVIVGVGGSATIDGGLGALDALGWTLRGAEVDVACDVTTTFLDAPALFGPQKGASPADVEVLEERLRDAGAAIRRRSTASNVVSPARLGRRRRARRRARGDRRAHRATGSTSSRLRSASPRRSRRAAR